MNLVLCLERECNVAPTSTKSSCGASANVFSFLEYKKSLSSSATAATFIILSQFRDMKSR